MKDWFIRVMRGRYGSVYGADSLTKFLLVLAVVVSIVSAVGFLPGDFRYLSYFLILILYFRFFSRNLDKRLAENKKFLEITSPFIRFFSRTSRNLKDRKNKYFKCPNCGQELRAPRKKGKISITCNSCKQKFQIRT
ncbi:hypothetical protein [Peptoniphilus catoniae]|uniref:hypothetical protein n=1 Tax=Peptoniphilus catoniae TaxID=1660341 RepID=UPI0010FF3D45|nr:hypothetical protein [Peptoniphilus catoniae]